jgi:hypothetical protein
MGEGEQRHDLGRGGRGRKRRAVRRTPVSGLVFAHRHISQVPLRFLHRSVKRLGVRTAQVEKESAEQLV